MVIINYFFEETTPFKSALPTKKWILNCLYKEGWGAGNINFIFCSDNYLQKINKQYLGKTTLTDVISFELPPPGFKQVPENPLVFGDVFISIDRIKENHKRYKTIFAKELKRVMIHGVLHLIGFNDKSKEEKLLMRQKENTYIDLK